MDSSLPGSSVHRMFQARILEWVAISFSRGTSWPRDQTWVSYIAVRFFITDPPGKPHGESQIIEMDECYPSNYASLLKTVIWIFYNWNFSRFFFSTKTNGKPSDKRLDIEGAVRTPPHQHEVCSVVGCSQASGCKKLFSVGLIGGRSDSPIFLYLLLEFIPSEFHPLHSEFSSDTTAETGRNRKSTWVSIQIMQFASQGLLAITQFWLVDPPACSCGSGIPWAQTGPLFL